MADSGGQSGVALAGVFKRWQAANWNMEGGARLPQVWRYVLDRDPWMRGVVMVIDLVFGGQEGGASIRIATEPVTSTGADGRDHSAIAALVAEPTISNVYRLGEAAASARSVGLTLDPVLVNPVELVRRGYMLAGIGEVSLELSDAWRRRHFQVADFPYEDRMVLVRGDMSGGVAFGAVRSDGQRELMELEVVDPRDSVGTKLPPWVVDSGVADETAGAPRWPTPHESGIGERYPVVVNGYDRIPGVRVTSNTNGPSFVFAVGTECDLPTVYVNGLAVGNLNPTYGWSTTLTQTDGRGTTVLRINFNATAYVWQDNDAVHVSCNIPLQSLNPVDAMRYVLERYSPLGVAGVNAQLFAEASAKWPDTLPAPKVLINAAGGGSEGDAIAWAESGMCASFPMLSLVWERGAYGCILTDYRADPVAELVKGAPPLLERQSLVQESAKGELYNDFVIRYGYNVIDDVWEGVLTRSAENSALCDLSQRMVGQRHLDSMDAPYIFDSALAAYVMDWMVAHWSLPSYVVEYDCTPSAFLVHRRGDTVLVSDDDFGWSRERATIEGLTYKRGKATMTLRVWQRAMDLGGAALSVGGV